MKFVVVFRDLEGTFSGYKETKDFEIARDIARTTGGKVYIRIAGIEDFQTTEIPYCPQCGSKVYSKDMGCDDCQYPQYRQEPKIPKLCSTPIGEEILVGHLKPGQGLRRFCLLYAGHSGECNPKNPDLKLKYRDGDMV